jgi:hypothetical protein
MVPASGATGVATNAAVVFSFNKVYNPLTVSDVGNIRLYDSTVSEYIGGAIALNGPAYTTVTFTPSAPLSPSHTYCGYGGYPFSTYIYDLAGNYFSFVDSQCFTTTNTPDSTPPTLVSATPAPGAANVGPNAVVTLIFSEALNSTTVNAANFALFNGYTDLNAGVAISSDNTTVTLTTTLPYSSTITVAVNTSVKDLAGNSLANPVSFTFNTETQPLTATPTVTQMRPANGATGVFLNDTITLFFSAPLSAATVPGAFYVSQNGALLTGSVVPSNDGRSAVWTGPGFQNSAYVQVFFTGATDTSGNPVNYYAASFTAAPPTSATPATTLVSEVPACCVSNVAPNTVVDLQFNRPINTGTVNSSSFYLLMDDALPKIAGTYTFLNNNTVLRFTPSAPLPGTVHDFYRVHYENSIDDVNGNPIGGSADNTFYFYMGGSTNNTTPTLTSIAPYNGATGVGDNATIRFSFNEPMDTLTIDPATVTLMNGATPIPFSMSFSGTTYTTVTLSPYAPLPVNATLTLAFTAGITDSCGNALAAQSITFQTGPGADFTAPYVIYSSINSNTPAVPTNSTFTLVFSKPLDRNTVSNANGYFSIYDNSTGWTTPTVTVSADGLTVTLVPSPGLTPSTGYQLYAQDATDLDGNAQTNFNVSFTTGAGAVNTPPTVLTANPANGAAGAPLNSSIEIQFSEAVSGTSLTQITLNGAPVAASLIYDDSVVHLTPASLLSPNTIYSVAVTGVQDLAGNTMTGTYSFSFTTGTNVDENATPNVLSVSANGLPLTNNIDVTNVPDNPTITITLDTPVEPGSLNNGALVLYLNSNTNITYPLNIALSADQKTITVTLPPGTLASLTEYQFRVGYNYRIRDWAGSSNGGQYYIYYFTTQ